MSAWDDMLDREEALELEKINYLIDQCKKGFWVTKKGKHLAIVDMAYSHLNHSYRMVQDMGPEGNRWMYRNKLKRELRRRSLQNDNSNRN